MSNLSAFFSKLRFLLPSILGLIACTTGYSVLDYYYVSFALSKGTSQTQASFVISAFKLCVAVGFQVGAYLLNKIDRRLGGAMLLFAAGVCEAMVATLYWIELMQTFYYVSFVMYGVRGLIGGMLFIFMVAPTLIEFPHIKDKLSGGIEAVWGIGSMSTILLSGFLIDLWAFSLPYICFSLFAFALTYIFLKSSSFVVDALPDASKEVIQDSNKKNYLHLFICPNFLCAMLSCFMCYTALGFNSATLGIFVGETFSLSATKFGAVAMLHSASYAVCCVFISVFGVKPNTYSALYVTSLCLSAVGFFLQGPVSFAQFQPYLVTTAVAQVFLGVGSAVQIVLGVAGGIEAAIKNGYPDNLETSGIIVGWTNGAALLGIMITPIWAAALKEQFTYRFAVDVIFGLNVLMAIAIIVLSIFSCILKKM